MADKLLQVRPRDHTMSFRRDKQKARRWQTWLQQHRDELLACGIPLMLLEDEWRWDYFLYEGYYTPPECTEPIISVDEMKREDMERLCLFLERELSDSPSYVVLNRLQFLLKRGRHAETSV